MGSDADSAHGGVFQEDKCSKHAKRQEIILHIWMKKSSWFATFYRHVFDYVSVTINFFNKAVKVFGTFTE